MTAEGREEKTLDTEDETARKGRRPLCVIIGAGFAGLNAARGLAATPVDILVIDRQNYFCFQPLLYQVATAALSPADIAEPIRRILRKQGNARVVLGEVTRIDVRNGVIFCPQLGTVRYDYLVIAAGATHAYFGHDAWADAAPGLKTIDDALELRRRMLLAFEAAELERDPAAQSARLTFVIVGGGPTGVELAGALREIAATSIPADFRNVDTSTTRVILLEGEPRLLPAMSEAAGAAALRDLEALGVEVRLETLAKGIDAEGVDTKGGRIPTQNVIWAAGVRAARVIDSVQTVTDRSGRIQVRPDCSLPGHPDVFAIGDVAHQVSADTGAPVPGMAQGAMQMGDFVARLIHSEVVDGATPEGRPAFTYRDKGVLATIGKAKAVADIGERTFRGWFAWMLWSFIHVLFLVSFRNRLFVMLSWAYRYVAHNNGPRLITGQRVPTIAERPYDSSGRSSPSPGRIRAAPP